MSWCEICKHECKIKDQKLAMACSTFDPIPLTGSQLQEDVYLAVFTRAAFHRINRVEITDDKILLIPNKKARKNLPIPDDDRPVFFKLGKSEIPMAFIHTYQKPGEDREYSLLTKGA